MEPGDNNNKDNFYPLRSIENLKDFSMDSLAHETDILPQVIDGKLDESQTSENLLVDQSIGPALTAATSSFDSPLVTNHGNELVSNQKPFAPDGDLVGSANLSGLNRTTGDQSQDTTATFASGAPGHDGSLVRETMEYAEDLARELITNTNQLVREELSPRAPAQVVESDEPSSPPSPSPESSSSPKSLSPQHTKEESLAEQLGDKELESGEPEKFKGEKHDEDEEKKEEEEEQQQQLEVAVQRNEECDKQMELVESKVKRNSVDVIGEEEEEEEEEVKKADVLASQSAVETEVSEPQRDKQESRNTVIEEKIDESPINFGADDEDKAVREENNSKLISTIEEEKEDLVEEGRKVNLEGEEPERKEEVEETRHTAIDNNLLDTTSATETNQQNIGEIQSIPETESKKNPDFHQTFQTAAGYSLLADLDKSADNMEFTKNYSDDLLMGQNDGVTGEMPAGGADLADFELPPYSGSSSGSEPRQASPVKQRKSSSSSSAAQASSSSQQHQINVTPPDLSAIKDLLFSSYSRMSHVFRWESPIESGVFFAIGATLILALTFFSIISVAAYSALGVIVASGFIRLYKTVMKTLNRSAETPFDHVWNKVLELNVSLPPEKMHELMDSSLGNLNSSLIFLKQVLLVEDKFATFKFGVFLYLLTYIGAWFNGMTLITITYLGLFSVPIFYKKNKTKIDEYIGLATGQVSTAYSMVKSKITSAVGGGSSAGTSSGKKQN